jgi:hypothetical protein
LRGFKKQIDCMHINSADQDNFVRRTDSEIEPQVLRQRSDWPIARQNGQTFVKRLPLEPLLRYRYVFSAHSLSKMGGSNRPATNFSHRKPSGFNHSPVGVTRVEPTRQPGWSDRRPGGVTRSSEPIGAAGNRSRQDATGFCLAQTELFTCRSQNAIVQLLSTLGCDNIYSLYGVRQGEGEERQCSAYNPLSSDV